MGRRENDLSGGACGCGLELSTGERVCSRYRPKEPSGEVEKNLRRWSDRWNVKVEKIDEQFGHMGKVPDVRLCWTEALGVTIIAEIKEIVSPYCMVSTKDGGLVVRRCSNSGKSGMKEIANPIRNKIRKAAPQLRAEAWEGLPTLMIVGHWRSVLDQFMDVEIPWAMKGGEHELHVNGSGWNMVLVGPETGGRQMWNEMNTSVSGIGRFVGPWCGKEFPEPMLRVFRHNNPGVRIPEGLPGLESFDS